jgi:phosphoglycerate dehydrogenase-like enzyme
MRIHIHNDPSDPLYVITRRHWDEAAARAKDIGAGQAISLGDSDAEFARAIREAEALITCPPVILRQFPTDAPALKLIFSTVAGVDRLAPFDWLPPGVALLNNRGAHAKGGEFAIMAVLMLANHLPALIAAQREARWNQLHGGVLEGKRLTVIGLGTLGGNAARHAAHFGMHVTGIRARAEPHPACARVLTADDLDAALPETGFLVLACPLTPATRNLMDRRRLGLLPGGAGVINIGRGAVLDQDALCDLLDAGHLGGAVLDVFAEEPVPPGHRLWTTRNLIVTPHVSSDDPANYIPRSLDILFDNLRALRDHRPLPNQVDLARGY